MEDVDGTGLGEGSGVKDISDELNNEEQIEGLKHDAEEKKEDGDKEESMKKAAKDKTVTESVCSYAQIVSAKRVIPVPNSDTTCPIQIRINPFIPCHNFVC